MNRFQMIEQIKEQAGYSVEWKNKLDAMTESQIIAIYFRLKRKGIIK